VWSLATVQDDGRIVFPEELTVRLGLEVGTYVLFDAVSLETFTMTVVPSEQFEAVFLDLFGNTIPAGIDIDELMAQLDPDLVDTFDAHSDSDSQVERSGANVTFSSSRSIDGNASLVSTS
jgi:bifunctional DNA-binding transcriptional regulator/antitoxin component of YhaV-PrlF toxin-antitoxin module